MISVIIPVREGKDILTFTSLGKQTYKDLEIIIVEDKQSNANKARNIGFSKSHGKYLIFLDADLTLKEEMLEVLFNCLNQHPDKTYSYCAFLRDEKTIGNQEFNLEELRKTNYINSASLIRRKDFCGFDENIKRFQDWDLWLTLAEKNKYGVYCGKTLFEQYSHPDSITNTVDSYEAFEAIKVKHKL